MKFEGVQRALYSYEAEKPDELSFKEDDILCIFGKSEEDEGWLRACVLDDQDILGMVPSNYLSNMEPISRAIAKYAYDKEEDNELSFAENDAIDILAKLEDDWWLARRRNEYGLVPSNYFQENKTMPQRPSQDIFAALANAEQTYDDDEVLASYTAQIQMPPQQAQLRWIDSVDVKKAWNGTFFEGKKSKVKGQLIIGDDGVLGFVSSNKKKTEHMKCMMLDVASYEKKSKLLKLKNGKEYKIELSKNHVTELQKSIKEAQEVPAEAEPIEEPHHEPEEEKVYYDEPEEYNYEEPEPHHYEEEIPPELPARVLTPQISKSPLSPVHAQLMQALGSPKASSPSALRESYVVSLYDYVPDEEDELNVNEDEKLLLIDDSSDDWWLVQRLTGSKRKGLVPSSYLQRIDPLSAREKNPLDEVFDPPIPEEPEEEAPLVKSPKSPSSRPGTPTVPFSFLDELRARNKSRETLSPPADEEPEPAVEHEAEAPPVPVKPAAVEEDAMEEEIVQAPRAPPAIPIEAIAEFEEALEESPVPEAVEEPVEEPEIQKIVEQPIVPEREVEPEIVRQPVKEVKQADLNLPKLKPVGSPKVKTSTKGNFLEQMLLRKQQDIEEGEIRLPEAKKPDVVEEETKAVVVKPNPWKNLSMKNIADKSSASTAAEYKDRSLPSRPSHPSSSDKPSPAETRLWSSANGQFQVEAKYLGFSDSKVQLHKLNGNRISVAIDLLSDRDKEFVYRKEGIPWESNGPRPQLMVNGFDWYGFFIDAGLDSTSAKNYGEACVLNKLPGLMIYSGGLTREVLLNLGLTESHAMAALKRAVQLKQKNDEEEAVRKNLEKIQLAKSQMPPSALHKPVVQPMRKTSDAFASIGLSSILEPVQVRRPSTSASLIQSAVPALEPVRKDSVTLMSTTVTTLPNSQLPPNPVMAFLPQQQQQMPMHSLPQHMPQQPHFRPPQQPQQQFTAPQQGYPMMQPRPMMGHPMQPQMNYQQPQQQQMGYPPQQQHQPLQQPARPSYLANTTGAAPMRPQTQTMHMVQQQMPQMQHGAAYMQQSQQPYPVLGTTIQRTEYYGQPPTRPPPIQAAMPYPQMNHQHVQPAYQQPPPMPYIQQPQSQYYQSPQPHLQQQQQQQQPQVNADRYSIFKYVDPSASQVLGPPPAYQSFEEQQQHQNRPNPS